MDGLLSLIVGLIVFAILVLIVNRSAKSIIFIGLVIFAFIALNAIGVLG